MLSAYRWPPLANHSRRDRPIELVPRRTNRRHDQGQSLAFNSRVGRAEEEVRLVLEEVCAQAPSPSLCVVCAPEKRKGSNLSFARLAHTAPTSCVLNLTWSALSPFRQIVAVFQPRSERDDDAACDVLNEPGPSVEMTPPSAVVGYDHHRRHSPETEATIARSAVSTTSLGLLRCSITRRPWWPRQRRAEPTPGRCHIR